MREREMWRLSICYFLRTGNGDVNYCGDLAI